MGVADMTPYLEKSVKFSEMGSMYEWFHQSTHKNTILFENRNLDN